MCLSAILLTGCVKQKEVEPDVYRPAIVLGNTYDDAVNTFYPDTKYVGKGSDSAQWTKGMYSYDVRGDSHGNLIDSLLITKTDGGSMSSEDIQRILNTQVPNANWTKTDDGGNRITYTARGYHVSYFVDSGTLVMLLDNKTK